MSESIELTFRSSEVCAGHLQPNGAQKTTFFVNALCGAAKDYFLVSVKLAMTFLGMITMMKE